MRHPIAPFALLALALASPDVLCAETRDLILVAGQSNAVGFDARPGDLPADPADRGVLFWWRCGDPPPDQHDSTGRGWTTLQPQPRGNPMPKGAGPQRQYGNFADAGGGFGPEMGFARTIAAREKRPLALVKAAFSGTGLRTDWNQADPGPGGACYRALTQETKAAMEKAAEKGIELRIRALIWVQGESDANAADAPEYAKRLGAMISALRDGFRAPDMIALIGVNTNFGNGKNAFMPVIVEQQKSLAARLPRCAYVDTSGLTYANGAHFDSKGTLEMGRRYAEALLKVEGGAGREPTNAGESSARKQGAADAGLEAGYQAWKASLPPDRRAWETVLEQNLGSFYLPLHKKDKVEGRSNAWDFVEDDPRLPRVLLIGDSVSRGYTLAVRRALAGKANVHRAPENCGATANGLKKLDVWLGGGKWDVIHFNFGIHDRATPAADYEQRLESLVTRMKSAGASLVWASTTPVPPDTKDGPAAARAIVEKNEIAARVMKRHGVAVDDLFAFITPHLAKVQNPKDVHFSAAGYELLGGKAAEELERALKSR